MSGREARARFEHKAAAKQSGEGALNRLQRVWGESPFYQAQLRGPAPDRFRHIPIDPRTPNPAIADMVTSGKFVIGADSIDAEGEIDALWDKAQTGSALHAFLHEYSWLRHAASLGEAGKAPAKALSEAWLDRYERWAPDAWAPALCAERLTQLCCHGALIVRGEDPLWRSRVLTSMARQTRHLAKTSHKAADGEERLMTALGLTIAGLCLPGCDAPAERGLEILRRELRLQFRPDGGHISRNPSRQLSIMIRLQMIVKAIEARGVACPGFLKHVSARAATFLYLFRCGDGRLAVFNGGYEDDGKALTHSLEGVDSDKAPTGFARHSGFQRLDAARLSLIADTGVMRRPADKQSSDERATARAARSGAVHHGDMSFSLASGRARLIVNCGAGAHIDRTWGEALRQPDAHSKLCSPHQGPESAIIHGGVVTHRRGEDSRGQLLEIERTAERAERPDQPMRHIRRFFLVARGDDVRGQDVIAGVSDEFLESLILRFHLHPAVKASMARDGRSIILAAPNHEGWRFRATAPEISLERSIYCGGGGEPAACEQIVVRLRGLRSRRLEDADVAGMVVKWGFRRVDAA